jgi:hypothetical protein
VRILGAFFSAPGICAANPWGRKKPGFPLQFLGLASHALRDFRCNPLAPHGLSVNLNLLQWETSPSP